MSMVPKDLWTLCRSSLSTLPFLCQLWNKNLPCSHFSLKWFCGPFYAVGDPWGSSAAGERFSDDLSLTSWVASLARDRAKLAREREGEQVGDGKEMPAPKEAAKWPDRSYGRYTHFLTRSASRICNLVCGSCYEPRLLLPSTSIKHK